MTETEQRKASLQREVEWLEKCLKSLDSEKRMVPWLALLYVLVIPGAMWKGVLGVIVVLFATTVILGTAMYIQAGHRSEYMQRLEDTKKALAEIERVPYVPR